MADQKDLDFTYSLIDKIFRFCFGETGDFSGAMYNGDFSLSLEQAQRGKYEFITENLNIGEGSKVLDIGCGWGPFLKYIEGRGAKGIGVSLSTSQVKACINNGMDVHFMDCKEIKPETFGLFDAIVSLGAFEHFCSKEEWEAGKQDEVYNNFFKVVWDILDLGGRFYLQTMTFSKNMIDPEDININADRNSAAYLLGHMVKAFPGSWLPYGANQIIEDAKPFFKLIFKTSGRTDYIETQKQWRDKLRKLNFRKSLFYLSLLPSYLTNKELRKRVGLSECNANRLCFEREIMDHYRLVFEKV